MKERTKQNVVYCIHTYIFIFVCIIFHLFDFRKFFSLTYSWLKAVASISLFIAAAMLWICADLHLFLKVYTTNIFTCIFVYLSTSVCIIFNYFYLLLLLLTLLLLFLLYNFLLWLLRDPQRPPRLLLYT